MMKKGPQGGSGGKCRVLGDLKELLRVWSDERGVRPKKAEEEDENVMKYGLGTSTFMGCGCYWKEPGWSHIIIL